MNPNDMAFTYYILAAIILLLCSVNESAGSKKGKKAKGDFEDENYGVKYASKCEGWMCKRLKTRTLKNYCS